MRIYTRTGDSGDTSLFDQTRVSKATSRVEAYGDVDELNACLGVARAAGLDADLGGLVEEIQARLFALGSRLADPSAKISDRVTKSTITEQHVEELERAIDRLEEELPALRRFVLPGGSPAGAQLHVARTVCRRAERRVVALGAGAVEPILIVYLNRLSDLLFVMGRAANHRAGIPETEW